MEGVLTWNDLAKIISEMTEEQRRKVIFSQDGNTGELFNYSGVEETTDENRDNCKYHMLIARN